MSRNGWPSDPYRANGWGWDAGIGIHASSDVEVYGNTLVENFNGIAIVQQRRDATTGDVYAPTGGTSCRTCTCTTTRSTSATAATRGRRRTWATRDVFTSRNNRWVNNTYYVGTNARPFAWMNGVRTATEWRAYNQDATGAFNP